MAIRYSSIKDKINSIKLKKNNKIIVKKVNPFGELSGNKIFDMNEYIKTTKEKEIIDKDKIVKSLTGLSIVEMAALIACV